MSDLILPTDSELEILQILWQNGQCTVRFVNDEINKHRELGYTTTLKTMQIMLDKGMLYRQIIDRSHIYTASLTEENTQTGLLKEFVDNTFRGSTSSLVMRMLGSGETSLDELNRIKDLINKYESNKLNNC